MDAAVCPTQDDKTQMDYGMDAAKQSVQFRMKCNIFTVVHSDDAIPGAENLESR